jgi:hypothetical protein
MVLHHFSEDPGITRFRPHVPATNPRHRPGVWAIGHEHAPLYWFPRDCPRVTAWPRTAAERANFAIAWTTIAPRVHAIESAWLDRVRTTTVYRYDLPADAFAPWTDAAGHWFAECEVDPVSVIALPDLLGLHADAGIELRVTPSLWAVHDLAVSDRWDFSIVRMHNARPRDAESTGGPHLAAGPSPRSYI